MSKVLLYQVNFDMDGIAMDTRKEPEMQWLAALLSQDCWRGLYQLVKDVT